MSKKNRFYVIEGDNGVGKTSLINRLSEIMPLQITKTPTDPYRSIKKYIHERDSTYGKFFYYLSSVFDASLDIQSKLTKSRVLCDRYIASSIVDFLILANIELKEIEGFYSFIKKELVMPDITFLIKCSHEERVKRILKRNKKGGNFDNLTREYSEKTDHHYGLFLEHEPNWYILDSTKRNIHDLEEEIKSIINDDNN